MSEYITFQQFSDLNTVGVLLLLATNIILIIGYFASAKIKNFLLGISYRKWIALSTALLAVGIVGANMYEYVYNDPPCMFCWYQRVTIYGMFLVCLVELVKRTRVAHMFVNVFAIITALTATYHYSFHFRRYVLGESELTMPCSSNPLVASCESAKVVSFGFATMPMMSIIVSLAIISISLLLYKKVSK